MTVWSLRRALTVPSPLEGREGGVDFHKGLEITPLPAPSAPTSPSGLRPGARQARPGWGEGVSRASAPAALTWLSLEPLTGRTHQLRVHCAEMGWPILGDSIYGNAPRHGGAIQHLHAREIVVPLYKNRPPIRVTAPVPAHMREALTACGWKDEKQNLAAE
jgi:tRNA pseudouridine32 synthase / 23S rRNA pseudouridine746 synthase